MEAIVINEAVSRRSLCKEAEQEKQQTTKTQL